MWTAASFAAGALVGCVSMYVATKRSGTSENEEGQSIKDALVIPEGVNRRMGEQKLVVGMRTDTKLKTSESASFLSDAVVAQCAKLSAQSPETKEKLAHWFIYGQAKIAVKVPNRQTMDQLVEAANQHSVSYSVKYMGDEPIVIALGPDDPRKVNLVSGSLKLL